MRIFLPYTWMFLFLYNTLDLECVVDVNYWSVTMFVYFCSTHFVLWVSLCRGEYSVEVLLRNSRRKKLELWCWDYGHCSFCEWYVNSILSVVETEAVHWGSSEVKCRFSFCLHYEPISTCCILNRKWIRSCVSAWTLSICSDIAKYQGW